MRKKKIWAKVLALSLCAILAFPVSAFAAGTEGEDVSETQMEEQVKGEEDVLPTIGKATLKIGEFGPETVQLPITSGSGKYKASTVEFRLESMPGVEPLVYETTLNEEQSVYDVYAVILFDRSVSSGKAGTYDMRVIFKDENGETVHEDTDSVKFLVEEDWSCVDYEGGPEFTRAWDGSSDVVFPFDPGSGIAKAGKLWEDEPSEGLGPYDEMLGNKYVMRYGTDFEVDMENGKYIIKGSFLKRIAEEDKSFGEREWYSVTDFFQTRAGYGMEIFYFCLSYDRNATEPEADTKPIEVTLPKDNTIVSAEKMTQLVEQNKEKDVVIHTPNGVDFTFAKGTMKQVDGKESYDFGSTIITDWKESKVSGVSEDEFAFRINYDYLGTLPGKAKISIPLGADSKWVGKTLYYARTESGKIVEQISKSLVDANGVYSIEQEHCSDYVATTKDMSVKQESVKSPKTGDIANTGLYLAIVFASGVLVLGALETKKRMR